MIKKGIMEVGKLGWRCRIRHLDEEMGTMQLNVVRLSIPDEANLIFGQSHFIKTVEDLHEIVVTTVPGCRFGLAFCEASGPCLIRRAGNDEALEKAAVGNAQEVACGHSFILLIKDAFPINLLPAIKSCQEVCGIFCATANPVEVIVAQTDQGRGVVGVIDGFSPKGVEQESDRQKRKDFVRAIGYKS